MSDCPDWDQMAFDAYVSLLLLPPFPSYARTEAEAIEILVEAGEVCPDCLDENCTCEKQWGD